MAYPKDLKDEISFCEEIDISKNEHGQYVYYDEHRENGFNLPYILQDYKEWLIKNHKL